MIHRLLSRAVSIATVMWFKRKLSRRTQELPPEALSAQMFLDCSACGAANSVMMPPMALPDENGKATQLAATFCARCGAVVRFDISDGYVQLTPEIEWENWCPRCDRRGDLVIGKVAPIFLSRPSLRWAWCPGCEKDVFVMTKKLFEQKAQRDAKAARRNDKLH